MGCVVSLALCQANHPQSSPADCQIQTTHGKHLFTIFCGCLKVVSSVRERLEHTFRCVALETHFSRRAVVVKKQRVIALPVYAFQYMLSTHWVSHLRSMWGLIDVCVLIFLRCRRRIVGQASAPSVCFIPWTFCPPCSCVTKLTSGRVDFAADDLKHRIAVVEERTNTVTSTKCRQQVQV